MKAVLNTALDFGWQLGGEVLTDSSSAIGICFRKGLGGRARHIRVRYLWIQEAIDNNEMTLKKGASVGP